MVGTRRFKLLLGIIIPFLTIFLMSENTSAVPVGNVLAVQRTYRTALNGAWTTNLINPNHGVPVNVWSGDTGFFELAGVNASAQVSNLKGKYYAATAKVVLQAQFPNDYGRWDCSNIVRAYIRPEQGTRLYEDNKVVSCSGYNGPVLTPDGSTVQYMVVDISSVGQFTTSTSVSSFLFSIYGSQETGGGIAIYSKNIGIGGTKIFISSIDYTLSLSDDEQVSQLGTIIDQNNQIIDQNQEKIDQDNEAYDNISGQTPEDINGSTNPQTTSLINVISGFISAFSNINATNCNLTLEFPDFAGGSRVVDICSGKDKAPRIVEIGSSLLLICVFVPLAFILVKMIYNEIRSWTNG